MLFGRWTNTTRRPVSGGAAANEGLGTSPRAQPPNAFSTVAKTASGSTAPTTSRNALFGRQWLRWKFSSAARSIACSVASVSDVRA